MAAIVRGRWWAVALLVLCIPPVGFVAVEAGRRWQTLLEHATSGPLAPSPDAVPGMIQPGEVAVFASAAVCLLLIMWCIQAGDASVRARRGVPVLPVVAGSAVVAFIGGVTLGVGVIFASALLCMGAYRLVMRLASGGYTDDGGMSGPEVSERDTPRPTPAPEPGRPR